MGPNTTFFSYKRSDSDFALKLARDLRQAGADVWLDQLDIKAGSRWDLSVEKALQDSSKMLVILSPDSVASHNVMDEVSFALEEGKTVIPIIFKPCDIPFRLRRLQHADFTKNYDAAFKDLMLALNLGKTTSRLDEKDDPSSIISEDQESEKAENKRKAKEEKLKAQLETNLQEKARILYAQAETASNEEERKRKEQAVQIKIDNESKNIAEAPTLKKKKYKIPIMIAGIIVVLVFIIMIVISGSNDNRNLRNTEQLSENSDQNSAEMLAWNDALVINSMAGFKTYQINYPYGSHFIDAQFKLDSIEAATKPVTAYEEPTAKKEVKQAQSRIEIQKPAEVKTQKPVESAANRFNLTGRWLTDENLEWRLIQKGDVVEITSYDKMGKPIMTAEGTINGNTLYYRKEKTGNDIEGKFTVSADGNSLDGIEYKFAGMRNHLKITRIQ